MQPLQNQSNLYRYTSNGEGVFTIGKRLLPAELAGEALQARSWLPKPDLPAGNEYRFYMTEKGKEKYEQTLLLVHKKYLTDIKVEASSFEAVKKIGEVIYKDEWQVVVKILVS